MWLQEEQLAATGTVRRRFDFSHPAVARWLDVVEDIYQDDCLCFVLLAVTHNSLLNEAPVMVRYLICYVHEVNSGETFRDGTELQMQNANMPKCAAWETRRAKYEKTKICSPL